MKARVTPIAAAATAMLSGLALPAWAQQAAAPASAASAPAPAASAPAGDRIEVSGIRAALESSLNRKRQAPALSEVVTAEDIGKMPDKNVADSLQRVVGVTISSASASEGGFDEADRVSLRGTNPSLTLTTINGHMVGSGDWFVLNQVGTVGRSVSYSLLPSELVRAVVVRKASTADLMEGGVAGTVDIQTRRPLEFRKSLTLEASVGGVYADLPGKTDPQASGLVAWKNEAGTFGVMAQLFSQKRHLRRDGVETLGYGTIAAGSAIATSNPDLRGVAYPNAIGSALFEQTREREGGMLDIQIKPMTGLSFDLSTFNSKMKAWNYNRNYLVWTSHILNGGAGQAPNPGYVVENGTLTSATFANLGTGTDPATRRQYVIVDQILRPGAKAETSFTNLDVEWRASDALSFTGKVGTSRGKGITPKQDVFEGDVFNTGASYTLHGTGSGPDSALPAGNSGVFTGTSLDWVFGASPASTTDKEDWAQIDGEFALDKGVMQSLKFGLRSAKHSRDAVWIAQGPNFAGPDPFAAANLPAWNGTTYPGDYGAGLGGNFLRNVWQLDPGVLEAWGDRFSNRDPASRRYFPGEFALTEKTMAGYGMLTFAGDTWNGNAGLRVVQTKVSVLTNVAIPQNPTGNAATPNDCAPLATCSVAGAITTSAFGAFKQVPVDNTHNDVMPSFNLRAKLSSEIDLVAGIARTIARPDFSALGGAVSLDDTNNTGNGGNPNLKPVRSNNYNVGVEWFFARRSLLQAGLFHMDLASYVSFGVSQATYYNEQRKRFETYNVSSPVNTKGKVSGLELGWQQPIANNFGAIVNYTFADGEEQGGGPLVGTSKHTYNLVGYFENEMFNARLAYTYRSAFFNGLDRATAQNQAATATLAATLGWKINDTLSLNLDGMNLNNPVLKYYAANTSQPTAFYVNGRQYYLTLRAKI